MTKLNNIGIEIYKQYPESKIVRRHIGLTPGNAIAIEEIKTLHEMETDKTIYPSPIINFAISELIKSINEKDTDEKIKYIMEGITKFNMELAKWNY